MKRALISGISGQDGSYLAEYLLGLGGYEIHGMIRRNSTPEHQTSRLDKIANELQLHYGDVTDPVSCHEIVQAVDPDEIYNLAGQSHVRISSDMPYFTAQVNGIGVLNMLDAMKRHAPHARFYQASSSEMFGNECDDDGYQRITTAMRPVSPYGIAKHYGFGMVRHYRDAHRMHCSNGVLFNHESCRRASNFVTAKVVKTAVQIKNGLADKLVLGNLDAKRDWGFSGDYVRAMHMMLQMDEPGDWVVATGQTRSVRDLCELVFHELGILRGVERYVQQDERYMRPNELHMLRGDSGPIRAMGWSPKKTFEDMVRDIIYHWECEIQRIGGPRW